MKTFLIEVFLDDNQTSYHNKTSEGMTADEARRVIAMLDEIKLDLIDTLRNKRTFIDKEQIIKT